MRRPLSETPETRRTRPLGVSVVAWLGLGLGLAVASWAGPQAQAQVVKPDPFAREPGFGEFPDPPRASKPTWLDLARPSLPEWLAMTADLLVGSGQLEPTKGWFARGVSATRFPWDAVAERLDLDHDGSISRLEFPGSDADFLRLDRDPNRSLTRLDFAFPRNGLERSRSKMIMSFADRDRDGKIKDSEYARMIFLANREQVTRHANFADATNEVEKAFQAASKEGLPYLTIADLRETVDLAARRKSMMSIPDVDADFEVGSRSTLLKALVNREIGVLKVGPSLGDPGPDFTLPTDDGRDRVSLAKLLGQGQRPLVLIFASYTSPGFRLEAGTIEKLFGRYKSRADFLLVYVREAHPSHGWVSRENLRQNVSIPQPLDDRGRSSLARMARQKLGLSLPIVVDSVDDRVGILYSGMPDRLYLLDPQGVVAYKGGRGPFGFKPDELEQSLLWLLQAEAEARFKAKPKPKPGAP